MAVSPFVNKPNENETLGNEVPPGRSWDSSRRTFRAVSQLPSCTTSRCRCSRLGLHFTKNSSRVSEGSCMCIPKIHLTWLALTIRIPPHPFLLRIAAVEAGHVAQQPVNKAPKAANLHGSPKPNRLNNRPQLRRASSGPLAASSTRRRARGSSANAPSTPTSGLRRRKRRRQTAQNRRAQLGLELLKDLLYALGKAHPDWRSRLPATPLRTSRRGAFC